MGKVLVNLNYYLDLIFILTQKEIKVRYKSSILGYLWSVLHPLFMGLVFYFAFKFIMKIPVENFTLYLITGLFPWQWFSNSVTGGCTSFFGNVTLIKKINFPRYFIPLSNVLNDAFHFIISIPIIFGFTYYYKIFPTIAWLYGIPLLIISQFLITYGVTLTVSSVNLFFRDLERLIGIGLNILFYLTPIVYTTDFIPERLKNYFFLNPLFAVIEGWHNLFMKGTFELKLYLISLAQGLLIFLFGFYIFKKLSNRFAEVI